MMVKAFEQAQQRKKNAKGKGFGLGATAEPSVEHEKSGNLRTDRESD